MFVLAASISRLPILWVNMETIPLSAWMSLVLVRSSWFSDSYVVIELVDKVARGDGHWRTEIISSELLGRGEYRFPPEKSGAVGSIVSGRHSLDMPVHCLLLEGYHDRRAPCGWGYLSQLLTSPSRVSQYDA